MPTISRAPWSQTLTKLAQRLPFIKPKPRDEIEFCPNGVLTLGVEVELQLINQDTRDLTPRAEELLAATRGCNTIKPEFYLSTVEVNTGICNNVQEVAADLRRSYEVLVPAADRLGIALSTTGSHPFAKYADCIISPTARYQELIDRNQWLTRRMTVYGLHVHIGMASGDDCIRYNNFFMHFLPHLLALSASSPFWQGTDTGLSSCRPTTYEALPTAGQPYPVKSWKEFETLYQSLKTCGSIRTLKDLWWDLRPSPGFGTLEIRVCDGCATLEETLALVALIHALAHWFADNGSWLETVNYPPRWLSRENKWRAIRYGLDAELVMTTEGKTRLLRDDLHDWLHKLQPYTDKLGYQPQLVTINNLLLKGTSSQRQLARYAQSAALESVVQHNVDEFLHGKPVWQ